MMPLTATIFLTYLMCGAHILWDSSRISFKNEYILLYVDYMSNWVKAIPTRTYESRVVVKFLRENIFAGYGMPKVNH